MNTDIKLTELRVSWKHDLNVASSSRMVIAIFNDSFQLLLFSEYALIISITGIIYEYQEIFVFI